MASQKVLRSYSCHFDKKNNFQFKHPMSAMPERKKKQQNEPEMTRLKIEENMLEKSLKVIMSFKYLEPHIVKELKDMNSDLERKRLQEQQHLKGQASLLEKYLHNLRKEVTPENLQHLDLDKFKDNLVDLEGKISVLKTSVERQKKVLKNQEKGLQESVSLMSQKIDEWAKPLKVSAAFASLHRNSLSRSAGSRCFDESINEYQKFLQERGGHTGGWDEADHLIYIRLLQKYHNKQTMFKHLHKEFPDKTLKELCEHDQWYTEYEELKAKQKEAITRWRENKNRSLRRTASLGDQIPLNVLIKEPKREIVNTNDREKQKQEIERWRNMKRLEMEMKDLRNEEEQQKKLMVEEAKRIRHAMQKAELERYKEERIKKEVELAQEREAVKNIEAEERAVSANKALKTFRQRDAESLARQRLMKERLEKERDAKEKMLESLRQKVRVNAPRDPSRLLKPTGAWKERSNAKKDEEVAMTLRPAVPLNLKEVPRLGIPLWRRNQ